MKYLLIAAIVAFVFVVVYSRIRPYLQLIQKVINSLNVSASVGSSTVTSQGRGSENKLVKCAGCSTWIPEDRAMNLKSGLATYCSPECMEKRSSGKERKLAG